ncbi:beta-lactamase-like protein [Leptodontidium sp. MPI-SDFR-AT-0119]|nr:beta-lactamase-like protein [Leptodontidium sp. MPI-SDFR-AT-0119]
MIPSTQTFPMLLAIFATGFGTSFAVAARSPLQVETFIHEDVSLNMVSSLFIGSEAATNRTVVSIFTTHNHPDHYLSARTVLDAFPNANPKTAGGIAVAAPLTSVYWSSILGQSEVVQNSSIPQSFPFSFFALPGDSEYPIHLLQPLTGDTIDEMLFLIPSSHTPIAGDTVFSDKLHLFMADMLTPALTASWISTLDFLSDLKPDVVIPGHELPGQSFGGSEIVKSTKKYLEFWQRKVEAKGPDYYTPQQLSQLLDSKFPDRNGSTSELMLNITAENFGRGGTRFGHTQNLTVYTDKDKLNGWDL